MAQDLKYGTLHIEGVPDDEPVFVLRSQDAAALSTVAHYAAEVNRHGASLEHQERIGRAYHAMAGWQFANPGRVKVPD